MIDYDSIVSIVSRVPSIPTILWVHRYIRPNMHYGPYSSCFQPKLKPKHVKSLYMRRHHPGSLLRSVWPNQFRQRGSQQQRTLVVASCWALVMQHQHVAKVALVQVARALGRQSCKPRGTQALVCKLLPSMQSQCQLSLSSLSLIVVLSRKRQVSQFHKLGSSGSAS